MKDISLHLLDIVRNSIVANSSLISVEIIENLNLDYLTLIITDNGKGMDKLTLEKVLDPFFTTRTTRKVGLGLSLLKANCLNTGGDLHIESELSNGTKVTATFIHSNIDRPPLGDIPQTILTILMSEENFDLNLTYSYNSKLFTFSTIEIKDLLGGNVNYRDYQISSWIEEYICENIDALKLSS